jgi:hypothetical protein
MKLPKKRNFSRVQHDARLPFSQITAARDLTQDEIVAEVQSYDAAHPQLPTPTLTSDASSPASKKRVIILFDARLRFLALAPL